MNRKTTFFGIFVLVFCLCGVRAFAQSRTESSAPQATPPARLNVAPPVRAQQEASPVSPETADISITATVTAKELLFEIVPNPTVEFPGQHKRDTIWEAERENLPSAVQPGVTYRNIGIRLKIVSRFADIDRIVAEALGEIPLTDEVQPPEKTMPQPGTPPPAASQPNGGSLK